MQQPFLMVASATLSGSDTTIPIPFDTNTYRIYNASDEVATINPGDASVTTTGGVPIGPGVTEVLRFDRRYTHVAIGGGPVYITPGFGV